MRPVTFDGNSINDSSYSSVVHMDAMGLPQVTPTMAKRDGMWPLFAGLQRSGKRIFVNVIILGSGVAAKQTALNQWFDPDDETPKEFVVEDDGGGNDRFVLAVCERLSTIPNSYGLEWIATLRIDGDVMWRETTPTAASAWSITATGQTKVVANGGEMECYPVLKIKPTSNKTASWPYKRFMVVRWRETGTSNYPVDIANNGLDTQTASTNFALASGDDLRVWVNGVEVDRWLDGPNTSTTKVWCNLDFSSDVSMTLNGAITSGQTQIPVNEAINGMPDAGILYIGTEVISYNSKSNSSKKFYNCTRGAKGTTAASHSDTDPVYWLQHDIWILYGNASAGTPSLDGNYKPMFSLSGSSNTSWDYNDFRDEDGGGGFHPRSGAWQELILVGTPTLYGGNRGATADPWIEVGGEITGGNRQWFLYVHNPCGITSANFVNGETYNYDSFSGRETWIVSGPTSIPTTTLEYQVPTPSADTWTAWSRNETLNTGSVSVGIYEDTLLFGWGPGANPVNFEVADVTLTLNSSNTPVIVIGAEQGNYSLACTITNNTTGDAILMTFGMELNEEIEVDTSAKTIIYLDDDSNQFQALELVDGARRDWLPLAPGNNTLQFDDTGTNGVTVTITYEERYYQ